MELHFNSYIIKSSNKTMLNKRNIIIYITTNYIHEITSPKHDSFQIIITYMLRSNIVIFKYNFLQDGWLISDLSA